MGEIKQLTIEDAPALQEISIETSIYRYFRTI